MTALHRHPLARRRSSSSRAGRRGSSARDALDGVVAAAMAVLALVALVLALVLVGSWVGRAVAGHGLTSVVGATAGVAPTPEVSPARGMMGA